MQCHNKPNMKVILNKIIQITAAATVATPRPAVRSPAAVRCAVDPAASMVALACLAPVSAKLAGWAHSAPNVGTFYGIWRFLYFHGISFLHTCNFRSHLFWQIFVTNTIILHCAHTQTTLAREQRATVTVSACSSTVRRCVAATTRRLDRKRAISALSAASKHAATAWSVSTEAFVIRKLIQCYIYCVLTGFIYDVSTYCSWKKKRNTYCYCFEQHLFEECWGVN